MFFPAYVICFWDFTYVNRKRLSSHMVNLIHLAVLNSVDNESMQDKNG